MSETIQEEHEKVEIGVVIQNFVEDLGIVPCKLLELGGLLQFGSANQDGLRYFKDNLRLSAYCILRPARCRMWRRGRCGRRLFRVARTSFVPRQSC